MPKRDIMREALGELIEEFLIKARDEGDAYLDKAKIVLEADGHVIVFRNNIDRDVYNIKVSHSGWKATR
jgi:hypothetical protein